MTIRVSAVVPTCKRPALLAQCLDALLAQAFDPATYEIIVVDDANCPRTRRVVEMRAARTAKRGPMLLYLTTGVQRGPAAARNLGWRAALGPVVAFTDDDCLPEPGWLRAGLAACAADVAGVAGRVRMPLPAAPTDYARTAAALTASEFVTASCFYRRTELAAVGGFDERFTAAWREDSDLYYTLLERGSPLVCAPAATVVHPLRPAPWGVSLTQQSRSMFDALLYKKHPDLVRRHHRWVTPWRYYAMVAALLTALGGLVRRRRRLALAAGALWALLTGRFCAQRMAGGAARSPGHIAEMLVTSAAIPPLAVFWRLRGALKFRVWFL